MNKKNVYLFIYDGFADWETAHLLTSLVKTDRYIVKTIAIERETKKSQSGLSVIPDLDFFPHVDLRDVDQSNTALLILPGGKGWNEKLNFEILPFVKHCIEQNIMLAASAEATLLLADTGLLNKRTHTSIDVEYLNTFSAFYQGENKYTDSESVYDKGIITASGRAPIDFSNTVLKTLDLKGEIEQSLLALIMDIHH